MNTNKYYTTLAVLLAQFALFFLLQENSIILTDTRRLEFSKELKDPVEQLSEFYNTVFDEEVSDKMLEIQKEIRVFRQCNAYPELDTAAEDFVGTDHPDSHIATISCVPVHYRIPSSKRIEDTLVFAILSADWNRRDAIRNTWAKGTAHFFILAGDWKDVENEYNEFGDILWVDQPDRYKVNEFNPRKGALTFKSGTLLIAMYNEIAKQNLKVEYFFKVDDDCYVDVPYLKEQIETMSKTTTVDYWGLCPERVAPNRWERHQWYVGVHEYPFTYFPRYCLGGHGYVLSAKFLECAVGEGHVEKVMYNVNEDVFVGTIAEKCSIQPSSLDPISTKSDHNHEDLSKRVAVEHQVKKVDDMLMLHEHAATWL